MGKRLLGMFLVMALGACNYSEMKGLQQGERGEEPGGEDPGTLTATSFAVIQATVLTPYCARCHRGEDPAGGVSVESYQILIDDGLVVPNKPDESLILLTMEDNSMPKRGEKPSEELIASVRAWIENGAIEN